MSDEDKKPYQRVYFYVVPLLVLGFAFQGVL